MKTVENSDQITDITENNKSRKPTIDSKKAMKSKSNLESDDDKLVDLPNSEGTEIPVVHR